jgi:hypothetical protein
MSKLTETQRAYDAIRQLVRAEILKKGSNTRDLQRFLEALDVAFYLLGWAQFEYLVRGAAEDRIDGYAKLTTVDRGAWQFVKDNIKKFALRKKLDVIFHAKPKILAELNDDYDLRNEAAHNYAKLPSEARNISEWLAGLEELVDKF